MTKNYEIPDEMRDFAEKSVAQARKAFDGFIGAAQKAVDSAHDSTTAMHSNAADVTRKTIAYAEQNVAAAFELAQRLVRARDPQEVMQLQAEYLRSQLTALQTQMRDVGTAVQGQMQQAGAQAQKAATEAMKRK